MSDTAVIESPPPSVLQIVPLLAGGGVARATLDVAHAHVAARGRMAIASAGGSMLGELARLRVPHIEVPADRDSLWTAFTNAGRLRKTLDEHEVRIVHARSRATAWTAGRLARRTGRKLVVTAHWPLMGETLAARWMESVVGVADAAVAVSHHVAASIRSRFPEIGDRLQVIPSGVNLDRFNPAGIRAERLIRLAQAWRLPDDKRVILHPARMDEDRGQTTLAEALARLSRRDVFCLFLGAGEKPSAFEAQLKAKIESLNLHGMAQIAPYCDDMPAAYMLADVVAATSAKAQGFSRIAVEAQAMGRPALVDEQGGGAEAILPNRTGWTAASGDAVRLAEALEIALALDGDERVKLARLADEHVRAHFTVEAMQQKTLTLHRSLA
jgi:glycosyltransferase involved in cell wall biosynthesis